MFNAYPESFVVGVAEHTNGGPAKRLETKDRVDRNGNQEHLCCMRKEIELALNRQTQSYERKIAVHMNLDHSVSSKSFIRQRSMF